MQTVHHMVFALAYLRDMNFVTQPGVELYKSIAAEIHAEAERAGGITRTSAWRAMSASPRQAAWRGRLTLYFEALRRSRGLPLEHRPADICAAAARARR